MPMGQNPSPQYWNGEPSADQNKGQKHNSLWVFLGADACTACIANRRMVHDTDIVELELRSKRFSLAVRKKEALEAAEPTIIYQVHAGWPGMQPDTHRPCIGALHSCMGLQAHRT